MGGNNAQKLKKRKGINGEGIDISGPTIHGRSAPHRIASLLKKRLDSSNLEKFRKSCFGRYLDIQEMILHGPLLYMLLDHLKTEALGEGILHFNINGVDAKFGPKEFFAITGLSFGPPLGVPESSDFVSRIFGNNGTTITKAIEQMFISSCDLTEGSGDDALKLGLCLFLYAVLIGRGSTNHALHLKYLNLCDDLNAFNTFPWGRLSYEYFVSEFYHSHTLMSTEEKGNRNVAYDVFGFAHCLQVWALEVFPDIEGLKEYRNSRGPNTIPRILGWSFCGKAKYGMFDNMLHGKLKPFRKVELCFSNEEEVEIDKVLHYNPDFCSKSPLVGTEPSHYKSSHAKRKIWFGCSDQDDEVPLELADLQPMSPIFSSCDADLFGLNLIVPSSSTEMGNRSPPSTREVGLPSDCKSLDKSPDMLDVIHSSPEVLWNPKSVTIGTGELEVLTCKEEIGSSGMKTVFCRGIEGEHLDDPFYDVAHVPRADKDEFDSSWIEELYHPHEDSKISSPCGSTTSAETFVSNSTSSDLSYDHGDRASREVQSMRRRAYLGEVADSVSPTDDAHHGTPRPLMYSPMKKYPRELLEKFVEWYHDAKAKKNSRRFYTPLQNLDIVTLSWVCRLYNHREKLRDSHCDALLNLLCLKARQAPHMFRQNWTCVDFFFWNKCRVSSFEDSWYKTVKYALGKLPHERPRRWCDLIEVYGIAHVLDDHWVAYEIDMIKGKIVVYDSMSQSNDWVKVASYFQPLSQYIPRLLEKAREIDPSFIVVPYNHVAWPVERCCEDLVQQTGVNDCGILAAKYVESLASHYSVELVNPRKCSKLRRYYSAQLYNAGLSQRGLCAALNM